MNISLIKQYVCLQTCAILFNVQYIRCLGHKISKLSKMVYPELLLNAKFQGKICKTWHKIKDSKFDRKEEN